MSRHRYVKNLNIAGMQSFNPEIQSYNQFSNSAELDDDALSDGADEDEMTAEQQCMRNYLQHF